MNVIRLYVAWEGVEPVRGQYNMTYLQELKGVVERCNRFNIAVILDAHQDVLSRFFCGEGFPDWAVSRSDWVFPYPVRKDFDVDENGYPLLE
jgi:endoglycosylceramidase